MALLKYCVSLCLLFFTCSATAQKEPGTEINPWLNYPAAMRFHIGATWSSDFAPPGLTPYRIIPAYGASFQWMNKQYNTQEIGLNSFRYERLSPGSNWSVSLRYEYIMNFLKHTSSRWIPSMGAGLIPFAYRYHLITVVSTQFPLRTFELGTHVFISPHLTYHCSKKVFFQLSLPLSFMRMGTKRVRNINPSLPADAQNYTIADFDISLAETSIILSVGVKF